MTIYLREAERWRFSFSSLVAVAIICMLTNTFLRWIPRDHNLWLLDWKVVRYTVSISSMVQISQEPKQRIITDGNTSSRNAVSFCHFPKCFKRSGKLGENQLPKKKWDLCLQRFLNLIFYHWWIMRT